MPSKTTVKKARQLKREGKAPTTQAGPFVEEEIEHIRHGKHGARSAKQAIAIGLSKARAAGVDLKPPKRGTVKESTRKSAESAYERGHSSTKKKPSAKRAKAATKALKREPRKAASKKALSTQAKRAAKKRSR
jgi:hypothetical protein